MNQSDISVRLLQLVKQKRIEQGLTLEELADRSGIHRTSLGLLERGERNPTLDTAYRLVQALGLHLGELLSLLEAVNESDAVRLAIRREVQLNDFYNEDFLYSATGLTVQNLKEAVESTYHTFDLIDAELISKGIAPISNLVELANLSSMVGNVVGAEIAAASDGLYARNRPHAYPDLLPLREPAQNLEIKIALETNKPKGHLPKAGFYIILRYVLASKKGEYKRGRPNRQDTVWVWEVRLGRLEIEDFAISNTEGDSGKTAVVKTQAYANMKLLYYNDSLNPYSKSLLPS